MKSKRNEIQMNKDFTQIQNKERSSNIELLRIIAMLLVMVVHASFMALKVPTPLEINTMPVNSFLRFFSEATSIICVNVFVLISGWFGIKARIIRLSEFIFQVIFFGVFIYVVLRLCDRAERMSTDGWIQLFMINNLWFIKSYIVLYIFAPILNTFVEKADKRHMKLFLIAFFILQTIHGFIYASNWFSKGYSPLSFMGLYLLARYIRLYPNRYTQCSKFCDLGIYLLLTLITTLLSMLLTVAGNKSGEKLYSYTSPLVIVSAVYFFLFFTKFTFKSKIVNWIALSSLAAYLVQCDTHFFEPIYLKTISDWFNTQSTGIFLIYTASWIILIFAGSILVDKIRILIWNKLIVKFIFINKAM